MYTMLYKGTTIIRKNFDPIKKTHEMLGISYLNVFILKLQNLLGEKNNFLKRFNKCTLSSHYVSGTMHQSNILIYSVSDVKMTSNL